MRDYPTHVPDVIVHFRRGMYGGSLAVRKAYEIHAVLLTVDCLIKLAPLGVVYDNLIIFAARYEVHTVRRKIKTVDPTRVFLEYLGHLEAPHDAIHKL